MSNDRTAPRGEDINLEKDKGIHTTVKLDKPLQNYKNAPGTTLRHKQK